MRTLPLRNQTRRGFTLIELLVVVSVLLILLAFTAGAVNYSLNAEKVGGAARQVQSYLAGARDRAIHAGDVRGVRFVRDPDNPRLVSSLLFIGPSEAWSEGNMRLERGVAGSNLANVVAASPDSGWFELAARNSLHVGLRIRIPNDRSGSWYTIVGFNDSAMVWPPQVGGTATLPPVFDPSDGSSSNDDPFPLKVFISPPYRDPATNPAGEVQAFAGGGPNTYRLELPNVVLPERPVLLPKGTVIDLDSSDIPTSWQITDFTGTAGRASGFSTPAFWDVMFSPRGTVTGDAASKGVLHFYVTELNSVDLFRAHLADNIVPQLGGAPLPHPIVPADEIPDGAGGAEPIGDRALISVFTQTGAVSAHPLDPSDPVDFWDYDNDSNNNEPDGIAEDPFYFAETGEVMDQ